MTSLSRELVFLILQFLDEEKFKDSVHRLCFFPSASLYMYAFMFFLMFYFLFYGTSFVVENEM